MRDSRNRDLLEQMGWKVQIVWECELKNPQSVTRTLDCFLHELANVSDYGIAAEPEGKYKLG